MVRAPCDENQMLIGHPALDRARIAVLATVLSSDANSGSIVRSAVPVAQLHESIGEGLKVRGAVDGPTENVRGHVMDAIRRQNHAPRKIGQRLGAHFKVVANSYKLQQATVRMGRPLPT